MAPCAAPAASWATLRHRIVGRHGEKRRIWLHALDVRERIGGLARPRVVVLAHYYGLQFIGVPDLPDDSNWLFISDLSGRDRFRHAHSLGGHSGDRLCTKVFLFYTDVVRLLLSPVFRFVSHGLVHGAVHPGEGIWHFLSALLVGMQHESCSATGSLMITNDFGFPLGSVGPKPAIVISLRMRPWLSRKTLLCVFREM